MLLYIVSCIFLSLGAAEPSSAVTSEPDYRMLYGKFRKEGAKVRPDFVTIALAEREKLKKDEALVDRVAQRHPLIGFDYCRLEGCPFSQETSFSNHRSLFLGAAYKLLATSDNSMQCIFFASGTLEREARMMLDLFRKCSKDIPGAEKRVFVHCLDVIYNDHTLKKHANITVAQQNFRNLLKIAKSEQGPYPSNVKIKGLGWAGNVEGCMQQIRKFIQKDESAKHTIVISAYDFDDSAARETESVSDFRKLCKSLPEAHVVASVRVGEGVMVSDKREEIMSTLES